MNRLDFAPYRRSMVGFDRLFDLLEKQAQGGEDKYPPFNIERRGNDAYRITLAVAGFKPNEIDIIAQQNLLTVQGRKPVLRSTDGTDETQAGQYLYVGIAQRAFERRFELADYVRVDGANLEDGLLVIDLVREVPEAMKPKKIAITGQQPLSVAGSPAIIENEATDKAA